MHLLNASIVQQLLQFHKIPLNKHCPICELFQPSSTRLNRLNVTIDSQQNSAGSARSKDSQGMPTIPHRAIEIDSFSMGVEPVQHFCLHDREMLRSAFEIVIPRFTHNLPRHGGVYSSAIHCQQKIHTLTKFLSPLKNAAFRGS